jgi:hypothetical protein
MPRRANLFYSLLEWLGLRRKPKLKKKKRLASKKFSLDGKKSNKTAEAKRRPVGLEAFCRSVAAVKDDPWPARVRDLSTGSIGLHLTRRFEPGTLLVIELEKKEPSLSHTLVGRVVHATQSSTGGWMVGCTLANKIADDDLQALLV